MNKFFRSILAFVFILIPVYVLIVGLVHLYAPDNLRLNIKYKKGGNGHLYTRLREADTTKNIDILVLGSSHAYRGFDPRVFEKSGYKIFNLGSSSQSHVQTEFLVKKYLHQINPKIVIYEVYLNVMQNDGLESFIDLTSNLKNPLELLGMTFKINSVLAYNTWIAASTEFLIEGRNTQFIEPLRKKDDMYITGGFIERDNGKIESDQIIEERHIRPKLRQEHAFGNTLKYLRNNNIEVILVQTPINTSYYQQFINGDYFDKYFEKFVKEELAKQYINFNKYSIGLDNKQHFYDLHHLNQEGVQLFNTEFIEILENSNLK